MHIGLDHLLRQFGYMGVFGISIVEMLGVPFPAETTLTICGIEWSHGVFSFFPLWLIAACGNMIGSTIAFAIGFYFGRPVILKYGSKIRITEERLQRAEIKFAKHRYYIVLFSKFISGIRILTPYLAGINRMGFIKFSLYNSISALCWSAFFILEGRYISLLWHRYYFSHSEVLLIVGSAAVITILWVRFNVRQKRSVKK